MSNLQYLGMGLLVAIIVWGLYAAYMYIRISLEIQKNPYKRDLLNRLIDGKTPFEGPYIGPGPGAVQIPRPMVRDGDGPLHPMTDEEMKEQSRKYVESQRRRERCRDAAMILIGSVNASLHTTPEHPGIVERALALAEELEKQNAARPLPDAPDGDAHDPMRGD